MYLGGPIIDEVSDLDLTQAGTRSFSIWGWNFGLQEYGDIYFFLAEPPWRDDVVVSIAGRGEFAAGLDNVPPPDLISIMRNLPTITLSAPESEFLTEHAQANGFRLNPFVTNWTAGRIDISLPWSVDLNLLPNPDAFGVRQQLVTWIAVFRNFVPSRPGMLYVTQDFFRL